MRQRGRRTGARDRQHAVLLRQRVERRKRRHEVARVGQVDIVTARLDDGAGELYILALKRSRRIDDAKRLQRLDVGAARRVAVEHRGRDARGLWREPAPAHDHLAIGGRQNALNEIASERPRAADDGDAPCRAQGLIAPEIADAAGPDKSCNGPSGFFSVLTSRIVGVPDHNL